MVGVGFLLVEDVFYFVRAFAETGSLVAVFQMFLIRIVGAGPYSHFLYTGLVGMGMAYAVVRRGQAAGDPSAHRRPGSWRPAVGAHFLWNSPFLTELLGNGDLPNWAIYVTVKGLPMLIGLVLVVRLARNRERRWFASLASGFHDDGAIAPERAAGAERRPGPTGGAQRRGTREGAGGKAVKGRLQREQLLLAMAFNKHGRRATRTWRGTGRVSRSGGDAAISSQCAYALSTSLAIVLLIAIARTSSTTSSTGSSGARWWASGSFSSRTSSTSSGRSPRPARCSRCSRCS